MKKRKKSKDGFTYRSYSFVDKDPVIDRLRTLVQDEGLNYSEIGTISGVSSSTLHNWFDGPTRRPTYACVAAVASSLGYQQEFTKAKQVNFEREIKKAKSELEAANGGK